MIPNVSFCDNDESISFECRVANVIRGIVATCFGANNVPRSLNQVWKWVKVWIPNGTNVHSLGLATTC